ncbi:MAG: hypothetical protein MHMPM18_001516 [Marteilia pararefringens]
MLSCVQTGALTLDQCYLSEIVPVLFRTYETESDWYHQSYMLNLSLGPYRLQQIFGADKEANEIWWKEKADLYGCNFDSMH